MVVPKANWVMNLKSRKHFVALLVGCVMVGSIFFADPAMAGCNSGSNANTDLLSSANCQAGATGTVVPLWERGPLQAEEMAPH
jgi:hypothetical protein